MPINIVTQIIGIVAISFIILSFQHKTRKGILVFIGIGCFLFAIHLALLGAITGAILNLFVVVQSVLFSRYAAKTRPKWPLVMMLIIFVIIAVVTWQGVLSIFPTLGTMLGAFSYWQRNPQRVRWLALSARPLWFVYNLASGSIAGVIAEVLNASSILVGIYRYRNKSRANRLAIKRT